MALFIRTVPNVMQHFRCSAEDARRYMDLREEGYGYEQAAVMTGLADPPDDISERQMQDEEQPDDESMCPECNGDGGDKWNDYSLPCPTCGGDGRLW